MSRVDPVTIAVYPGGKSPAERGNPTSDANKCNLVEGAAGYFPGAIDLDCFKFPEDLHPDSTGDGKTGTGSKLAYAQAVTSDLYRNRLTALLLKHSDDVCIREMGSLTADQATTNASLNILGTAATTAANIVTGEQAQAILTGVGTFAGATRSHIDADVYRNTVAYAISRAITIERERQRGLIEARYSQPVTQFTVDDAIRAANAYHGVCSFYRGLELVLASVEGDQRTRDAQARREQIDELERQVQRYRDLLANKSPSEDAKTYTDKIGELLGRIQQLTLAAVAVPSPAPKQDGTNGDATTKPKDETPKPDKPVADGTAKPQVQAPDAGKPNSGTP